MSKWLMLVASLPGAGKTPRMRVWRALRASGAATLRDGVYLLPATTAARETFAAQAAEITAAGGSARILPLEKLDEATQRGFAELFDRSADYDRLLQALERLRRSVSRGAESEARRRLAALRRTAGALQATDFFPGPARARVERALSAVERAVNQVFASDEPQEQRAPLRRFACSAFRKRGWATRRHLWIDRAASAWLIRRFIDPEARFEWLADPKAKSPRAVGFDYDGADFTHTGGRITFEVLAASFGLEGDPAITRLGALVRYLDIGGPPVGEAAGVESVMVGLRSSEASDDEILRVMSGVFNALYAAYSPARGSKQHRSRARARRSRVRSR